MTEVEILNELERLDEKEIANHTVIKRSRNGAEVINARDSNDYIQARKKFLNDKLKALKLQKGLRRML